MSVNKVILVGRLGKDPDVRFMPNGEAVANVTLATTESWKDKSGAKQEKTEWHNLVFYRRTAEVVGEYLKKGSQVYIEGKLQTRKWQTKEGQDRYTTEIIVSEMQMLGGKSQGLTDSPSKLGGQSVERPAAGRVKSNVDSDEVPFDIPQSRSNQPKPFGAFDEEDFPF